MYDHVKNKNFLQSIAAGMFILILFAAINALKGAYIHALIEVGFALAAAVIALLFRYEKIAYQSALIYFVTLVSILYLYLFYHGGIAKTGIMWSLSFPVFAFLLSNKRMGIFFSVIHFTMMIGIYSLSQLDFFVVDYEAVVLRQTLSVYILISILAYVYQSKVQEKSDLLKSFNNELKEKIELAVQTNREQELHIFEQTKQAQMGELIGMIAHQWRQPLNALSLIIQKVQIMHKRDALTSQMIEDNVSKSMTLIDNMSTTINDFMNYLKVDREKHDFTLDNVASEIKSILFMRLDKEGVTLEFDLDEHIQIHSYKSELTHVLSNLIFNAIDAFEGKETTNKKIILSAIKDINKNIIEISVKDNAGGIPKEVIDNIFNPYFTTKEQGKGTGIGLNMSKRIVETVLDGTITVDNSEDGAVFTVQLPLD